MGIDVLALQVNQYISFEMFWLRLFGIRRSMKTSAFEDLGLGDDVYAFQRKSKDISSGPRKSIAYVPEDLYDDGLAPL